MSETVFNNPKALEKLNKILHPLIKEEKDRQLEKLRDSPVVVYDCPLLFETGEDKTVDEILVITADSDLQKERLKSRNNYSDEEIEKRIKAQQSESKKISQADAVIFNNGTVDDLKSALGNFLSRQTK